MNYFRVPDNKLTIHLKTPILEIGGHERTRTAYLCNANATLYKLSYRPKKLFLYLSKNSKLSATDTNIFSSLNSLYKLLFRDLSTSILPNSGIIIPNLIYYTLKTPN